MGKQAFNISDALRSLKQAKKNYGVLTFDNGIVLCEEFGGDRLTNLEKFSQHGAEFDESMHKFFGKIVWEEICKFRKCNKNMNMIFSIQLNEMTDNDIKSIFAKRDITYKDMNL